MLKDFCYSILICFLVSTIIKKEKEIEELKNRDTPIIITEIREIIYPTPPENTPEPGVYNGVDIM